MSLLLLLRSAPGDVLTPITGTAELLVPLPRISGTGTTQDMARGVRGRYPSISTVDHDRTVRQKRRGKGSLRVCLPSISGTGQVAFSGTAALTAPVPSISGAGHVPTTGGGQLQVSTPRITAAGSLIFDGTGSATSRMPAITGEAASFTPPWLTGEDDFLLGVI